jgi:alanyl-tRNA synthetase
MIRECAKEIQGGGGGQPFFATAGGKNADGLSAALASAKGILGA